MTLSVFPSGFNDNALIEQLQVSILDKYDGFVGDFDSGQN